MDFNYIQMYKENRIRAPNLIFAQAVLFITNNDTQKFSELEVRDIHARDEKGHTLLHIVCIFRRYEMLLDLLRNKGFNDFDATSLFNDTALILCCRYDFSKGVDILGSCGANGNLRNNNLDFAIIEAVKVKSVECVRELLSSFDVDLFDVSQEDDNDDTALHICCRDYSQEEEFVDSVKLYNIIKLLLNNVHTEVNGQNEDGELPILYLAEQNKLSYELLELFISCDLELDRALDDLGNTLLMLLSRHYNYQCIELLLTYPEIGIDLVNDSGRNALMIALETKQHKSLIWLYIGKININTRDVNYNTALHYAAEYITDLELIKQLVVPVIKVPSIDIDERGQLITTLPTIDINHTPLHVAAKFNNSTQVIQYLATIYSLKDKDEYGMSAEMYITNHE